MEVKVNVIELASELAHQKLIETLETGMPTENRPQGLSWEMILYKDLEADALEYTDFWQDKFNSHYDYYFEMISNCSIE